jgi:DNA-binding transcriptional ArsR family regulator
MNRGRALRSLAALAQETRLDAFRLLVQSGPEGLAAGELAARLDISPPALSFHLRGLAHAGLIRARQDGRFIYYSADFDAMQSLLGFLTENCCSGSACAPGYAGARKAGSRRTS